MYISLCNAQAMILSSPTSIFVHSTCNRHYNHESVHSYHDDGSHNSFARARKGWVIQSSHSTICESSSKVPRLYCCSRASKIPEGKGHDMYMYMYLLDLC